MTRLTTTPLGAGLFKRGDDLVGFCTRALAPLEPATGVLVVTTKIVSLAENRLVTHASIEKTELVKREADRYLGPGGFGVELTVKEGLLLPSAGIDESNSETGDYIVYPRDPLASAETLGRALRQRFKTSRLGVLLSDSRSLPLRRGVVGAAVAHWGFRGCRSRVGELDLHGRPLKATHVDVADALASAAVLVMGEAAESTPLAFIEWDQLEFLDGSDQDRLRVEWRDDLFLPYLTKITE